VTRTTRLVLWLGFVALLVAAQYAARATGGKPDRDALYQYSTAANGIVDYAIVLAVVLAIAGASRELLTLRRPDAWGRALRLALGALVFIYVSTGILDHFLHAGQEQGLTPSHWEPSRAGPYAVNFVVIALVAPVVEELTYRGLGYSLLEPFGRWAAILVTGALFAASHGLVEGFPELMLFGCALAWLRSRTGSVFPGMAVHAVFNATALILVVLFA
jgi:membrane protease YdiL (CAAX protease family)